MNLTACTDLFDRLDCALAARNDAAVRDLFWQLFGMLVCENGQRIYEQLLRTKAEVERAELFLRIQGRSLC